MTRDELTQLLENVRELRTEAERLINRDFTEDFEDVLLQADTYSERLEAWRKNVEDLNPFAPHANITLQDQEQLKTEIRSFQEKHLALTEKLSGARDIVTKQMGDLHKRAKALRTYVDRFPARITIAGKRKG